MIKYRWLIYTVIVGLLPFLARTIIFFVTKKDLGYGYVLNENDFIFFGLILNITNINELEHIIIRDNREVNVLKYAYIGFSVVGIAIISGIYFISCACHINSDQYNLLFIKILSIIIAIVSFAYSYNIINWLSIIDIPPQEQGYE